MSLDRPLPTQSIQNIGVAYVFIGDPFVSDGMDVLAPTEGDVVVNTPKSMNNLTAPELTGGIIHEAVVMDGDVSVVAPFIGGDEDLWEAIDSLGLPHSGFWDPQDVVPTSVLVIPKKEVPSGGMTLTGSTWAPAPPSKNSIWLWRAYPTYDAANYSFGNGGKMIIPVTFHGMFYADNPDGHHVYTRGNPLTYSISVVI